jgi:hypothetical protein
VRRETGRKDSYEHAFNRLLDRNRERASNTAGVGGLLFIPSINLEPRMNASAKVRIALPSGFALLILLTHTIATSNA